MTTEQDQPKRNYKRTSSWGSTRKLPSERYQASYLHQGKRHNAPHTFDAKRDAEAWLAGVRTDIQRGKWRDPDAIHAELFGEFAAVWLEQRVSAKGSALRPRTLNEYRRQLERGLSYFTGDRFGEITPARVRAWHSTRVKQSGATAAAREAALLRAISSTAVEDGVIERNPVDSKLTRSSSSVSHRPPTLDELAVIVEDFRKHAPQLKLAILLAAYGGLRLSEWRALRRSDLTIVGDRVMVSVTRQAQHISGEGWVVGPPKSEEGVRVVPLPASLASDVRHHLSTHVRAFPESLLFQPSGQSDFLHDAQFNSHWNRARSAAAIPSVTKVIPGTKERRRTYSVVREHDLRHFHLSHYAASGATLAELKARAGHSTMQAAMVYQHAVTDRGAELADAMPTLPSAPHRVARLA